MSEVSIGSIPLPRGRSSRIGEKVAREAMFKMLGRLQIGSLTLHEGPQSHHFGEAGRPGEPQAEVHIHNPCVYGQMLTGGSIASGESYIHGHWSSPDPLQVTRLFSANLTVLEGFDDKRNGTDYRGYSYFPLGRRENKVWLAVEIYRYSLLRPSLDTIH